MESQDTFSSPHYGIIAGTGLCYQIDDPFFDAGPNLLVNRNRSVHFMGRNSHYYPCFKARFMALSKVILWQLKIHLKIGWVKAMDTEPKNDLEPAQAQVKVTALSSTMFYTAGRIDAADRKASTIVALSLGMLGLSVGAGSIELGVSGPELLTILRSKLSIIFSIASLFISLLGIWARQVVANDWVSQNFLGSKPPDEISVQMSLSDETLLEGMISSQQALSRLVRAKNRYTNFSIIALVFSAVTFAVGH